MTRLHRVAFPGTGFAPMTVPEGASLALHLTVLNSPLLFGCRSGLCGTCLVEVEEEAQGTLRPPDPDEAEALALYAPDNPRARLACQLHLDADVRVRKIDSA